eukprot:295242-Chlamydomonas_euryale.AAC.13
MGCALHERATTVATPLQHSPPFAEYYDTDTGRKMSLAKSVERELPSLWVHALVGGGMGGGCSRQAARSAPLSTFCCCTSHGAPSHPIFAFD